MNGEKLGGDSMTASSSEHQIWIEALGNDIVAQELDEIADLLTDQGAKPFRITAYHNAAKTLGALKQPVHEIYEEDGLPGLMRLRGIGRSIGHTIEQFLQTGNMPLLDRLRGESAPERIFTTVADIGPKLASRIHEELDIETLGELETAAWDGRLTQVPGIGRKRTQAVREQLAGRFRRQRQQPPPGSAVETADQPPVAELLDIDREYLHLVELDRLPKISPRRFNPEGKAWLPISHAQREQRHYTALFSNTARAHELGTTRDWVVIYRDDDADHGQWTVITSTLGKLKGKRIVRGREQECAEHYAKQTSK
jgi:hypothetical protein